MDGMTQYVLRLLLVLDATLATERCISDMTFWHGRCYNFFTTPMDVKAARDLCHRKHSTLTTVDTAEEMSWVITRLRTMPSVITWHISLHSEARTHIVSHCNWTEGAPVVYHRYASPNASRLAERCVVVDVSLYGSGTCAWRDVVCDSRHAVICSRLYLAPVPRSDESEDRASSGTTEADSRPSAQAMGYIAIILVFVEFWCVAMLDWHDCVRNVDLMKRNLRCCLRKGGSRSGACNIGRREDNTCQVVSLPTRDLMDMEESAV